MTILTDRRSLLQAALGAGLTTAFITRFGGVLMPAQASAQGLQPSDFSTLYVVPASGTLATPPGTGTKTDPFALAAGEEYALNQLIRGFMDRSVPLVVQFGNGVYQDVRLQIIRQGLDTTKLYLRDRVMSSDGQVGIGYHSTVQCNDEGENCRVQPQDFAIGSGAAQAPLILEAQTSGQVIFDGSGLTGLPDIDDVALLISGAINDLAATAPYTSTSQRIRNVLVQGLSFRNYRNGIHVTYAEGVTVSGCILSDIGNRGPRAGDANCIGTFGLRADGDSRSVLMCGNTVQGLWNDVVAADGSADQDDPGLIHGIYQGYAHDVVFKDNVLNGCSGPMVKFGYYPTVTDGSLVYQYPTSPRDQCTLFIGNSFTLSTIKNGLSTVPIYAPEQAFIEENSSVDVDGKATLPASGMIFVGNRFINMLPAEQGVPVVFLRQEIPPSMNMPLFPGWTFAGNVIEAVTDEYLIAVRTRGTPLEAGFIQPVFDPTPLRTSLVQQMGVAATVSVSDVAAQAIASALAGISSGLDAAANAALLAIARSGTQPWLTSAPASASVGLTQP
ncbi:MAG: hypothetical protein ACRYGI_09800 [Janthinobacterium lividum]